jgi:hypothetical protein
MTVIAWDGKTLAADKLCVNGGLRGTVTKIFRAGDCLVGGSGDFSFVLAMVDWVQKGRDPAAFPADQRNKDNWQPMLVIEADGTPSLYDQTPFPIRQEQAYIAIGSGRDFAMAAMYLRKTAVEAVEVAIALNSGCGNGIDELRLA